MHQSDESRRGAPAAGLSPTDRRAPPGDLTDDEDDEHDLVSAVEDLVNDLVPPGE